MKNVKKQIPCLAGLLIIFSVLYFSCAPSESELKSYLDTKEEVYEEISVAMGNEVWNLYSQEGESDLETPRKQYAELFGNDTLNTKIETWYKKEKIIEDPILRRRVKIWHNILTAAKVDLDEEIFTLEDQLTRWLADTEDSLEKPSSEELTKMTLELMKLRNEKAKEIGFKNYADMVLEITDVGSQWFSDLVNTIDSATEEPYRKLLEEIKQKQNKDKIEFKDVYNLVGLYYMNSRGPQIEKEEFNAVIRETIENIGIEYDALPVRFVEKRVPFGGNGLAVRIPDDFRIVVNINMPIGVWMHELGHGLQGMFTTTEYPILKGYEWCKGSECGAYMEGMAEVCARLVRNPQWLKKYTDQTEEEMAEKMEIRNLHASAYFRFWLARLLFEIEIYRKLAEDPVKQDIDTKKLFEDPEKLSEDLKQVAHELNKRYLFLDISSDISMPLANALFVSYPVYLQSYLIADIISWQIHNTLEEKFGVDYVFNKEVGAFLKKSLYAQGELDPWKTRIKSATGIELDIKGYLASFGL